MWVHRGAGAYICGEETALLDSLEGKRGNPRLKPPFPAVKGLFQGPTLINNVETLMNAPLIMAMGGAEYAKIGTETSTGTKVVSVSGCVRRPGNYEIELGVPTREIIFGLAGGPPEGRSIKCFYPGGSSSPVLPGTDANLDLPYDFDSIAKAGSMLGSGAIIVVDDSIPIIDVALKTAKFYRHESCGKCTPCREGTNWTVKMLERDRRRRGDADGPRHHGVRPGPDHRQLPVRARRRDGDADRLDDQHFRDEFEAHIEAARERNGWACDPAVNRAPRRARPLRSPTAATAAACLAVPRPPSSDHLLDRRPRGARRPRARCSVDAAKYGDVEIPVFCYEPKLGQPVGACRMCLVEIEGIPKLQTGCSTPVKDGMVVPHADRSACTTPSARWSSSCSSTTRSTARSATRAASARCRTSPTAGAPARRASSSPSATSASRSSSRR
jgi:hypothetical protein